MPAIQNNDVLSFSAQLSMRGGSSGSISLVENATTAYTLTDFLGEQYSVVVQVDGTNHLIYKGIVSEVSTQYNPADNSVTHDIGLESATASLSRKPVNTASYSSVTGKVVLDDIVGKYGSVAATQFDFTSAGTGSNLNYIVVQGDSCIDEARKVSQASVISSIPQELYTDHDGVLKTAAYVTSSSVTLASDRIKSVSKQTSRLDGFSAIRVRGRMLSLDESGATTWYDETINIAVASSSVNTVNRTIGVSATREEIRAAKWFSSTANVSVSLTDVTDTGQCTFSITKSTGFSAGNNSISLKATGAKMWELEKDSISLQNIQNIKPSALSSSKNSTFGSSEFISWSWYSQKESDAVEEGRVDLVGRDTTLENVMGVRWFTVDNIYIDDTADAAHIGEEEFKKFKRSQEVYTIEVVWYSALKLNTGITFTDPITGASVSGTITEISISYDPSNADCTAQLTVEKHL